MILVLLVAIGAVWVAYANGSRVMRGPLVERKKR